MGFTTTAKNYVLDKILKNTDFTPASALYMSLHTADPGQTGASEVTGGSYARQSVSFNSAASGVTANTGAVSFTSMPAATVTHWGLWSADTGGTFWLGGYLAGAVTVTAGQSVDIAAGDADVIWQADVTKGIINTAWNTSGYVTSAEIVGLTSIPNHYMAAYSATYKHPYYYVANLTLPDDLTTIGTSAFQYLSSLALTSLPSGVTSIGNSAFYYCTSLDLTSLPSALTTIGTYAFYSCFSLSLTTLNNVTSIGAYALQVCTSLTTISSPKVTAYSAGNEFKGCTGLTTITLGSVGYAVTAVASTTFSTCTQSGVTINIYVDDPALPPTAVSSTSPWGLTGTGLTINYLDATP